MYLLFRWISSRRWHEVAIIGTLDSVWSLHVLQVLPAKNDTLPSVAAGGRLKGELQKDHHWIEIKSEHMNGWCDEQGTKEEIRRTVSAEVSKIVAIVLLTKTTIKLTSQDNNAPEMHQPIWTDRRPADWAEQTLCLSRPDVLASLDLLLAYIGMMIRLLKEIIKSVPSGLERDNNFKVNWLFPVSTTKSAGLRTNYIMSSSDLNFTVFHCCPGMGSANWKRNRMVA